MDNDPKYLKSSLSSSIETIIQTPKVTNKTNVKTVTFENKTPISRAESLISIAKTPIPSETIPWNINSRKFSDDSSELNEDDGYNV